MRGLSKWGLLPRWWRRRRRTTTVVVMWWWFGPLVGPSASGSVVRALRVTIPSVLSSLPPFLLLLRLSFLLHDALSLSLFLFSSFSFLLRLSFFLAYCRSSSHPRSFYRSFSDPSVLVNQYGGPVRSTFLRRERATKRKTKNPAGGIRARFAFLNSRGLISYIFEFYTRQKFCSCSRKTSRRDITRLMSLIGSVTFITAALNNLKTSPFKTFMSWSLCIDEMSISLEI